MLRVTVVVLFLILGVPNIKTQQTTSPDDVDEPVLKLDMKSGMHPPKTTFAPDAEYSPEARQKRVNGKCLVALVVDSKGIPRDIHLVRCSDWAFGEPSLGSVRRYKFNPATSADDKPIAVKIAVEIDFRIDGGREVHDPVRCGFGTPPGVTTPASDEHGVYPLTKDIVAPSILRFNDLGYGTSAFVLESGGPCDVILTIDDKGKPSDPKLISCGSTELTSVAIKSLIASKYKPGLIHGKAVPIRMLVHLQYGESPPNK